MTNIRTMVEEKLAEIVHMSAQAAKSYDTAMTWAFVDATRPSAPVNEHNQRLTEQVY